MESDSSRVGVDGGVASVGGWICQNEPEHENGGEVKMYGGPFLGVQCPECGRMTAHPDGKIPYSDPPHTEATMSTTPEETAIDEAIKQIATEKTKVEDEHPRREDPGSTDDAYLHGKWRGLKFALETLKEVRESQYGGKDDG